MTVQPWDYRGWIYKCLEQEIDKWFVAQCQNNHAAFYLYYTPGEIRITDVDIMPPGFTMRPGRIHGFNSKEQWMHILLSECGKWACLPTEEGACA